MPSSIVHPCGCPRCRADEPHADRALHQHINLLFSRLNEQQRRWFVALEVERLGRGGETLLAQIIGLNRRTIRRGRRELAAGLAERSTERVRAPGGRRAKCRIRSFSRLWRRCSPPRLPVTPWAGGPRVSAVPCGI